MVSAAELDEIVTESIGIRWATAGPFESFHLGGGPGGMRHFLEHLGPGMARRWKVVEQPELDEPTVELISGQVEERFAGRSYEELTGSRDRQQLGVIAAPGRPDAARRSGAVNADEVRRLPDHADRGAGLPVGPLPVHRPRVPQHPLPHRRRGDARRRPRAAHRRPTRW